jgi:hypothetical protein
MYGDQRVARRNPVADRAVLHLAASLREAELVDTAERLEHAYDRQARIVALDIPDREAILRVPGRERRLRPGGGRAVRRTRRGRLRERDEGRASFVSAFAITARPARKALSARQNDGFETLASSLPPSRETLRRRPVVEHLVVHLVTTAQGVPHCPCGGAVRHLPHPSRSRAYWSGSRRLLRLKVITWARPNHWTFVQTTLTR